ncbi:hypothetical protein ACFY2Z_41075 [Streptomyces sp. NPDC001222]|uniref:hypothetical protein n=1 Tax=Streptomyces sp. NPDC001222 TaxID=3364548 RepID=UPI0036CCA7EB
MKMPSIERAEHLQLLEAYENAMAELDQANVNLMSAERQKRLAMARVTEAVSACRDRGIAPVRERAVPILPVSGAPETLPCVICKTPTTQTPGHRQRLYCDALCRRQAEQERYRQRRVA